MRRIAKFDKVSRERFLEDLGDCSYNSGLPLK